MSACELMTEHSTGGKAENAGSVTGEAELTVTRSNRRDVCLH